MSHTIRRYVREKEELEFRRGYTEQEMQASALRKAFLKKYILNFDINFYTTQVERDWAQICKREARYDVVYKSLTDGFFAANMVSIARIFMTRRMAWGPYLIVWPLTYFYLYPLKLQKHNKKLFDMCNVGDDYYLGNERNKVLKECNRILDREDF